MPPASTGLLGGAGSASQLSFLQSLVKTGGLADPMEVIRTVIDSPAMQVRERDSDSTGDRRFRKKGGAD